MARSLSRKESLRLTKALSAKGKEKSSGREESKWVFGPWSLGWPLFVHMLAVFGAFHDVQTLRVSGPWMCGRSWPSFLRPRLGNADQDRPEWFRYCLLNISHRAGAKVSCCRLFFVKGDYPSAALTRLLLVECNIIVGDQKSAVTVYCFLLM